MYIRKGLELFGSKTFMAIIKMRPFSTYLLTYNPLTSAGTDTQRIMLARMRCESRTKGGKKNQTTNNRNTHEKKIVNEKQTNANDF